MSTVELKIEQKRTTPLFALLSGNTISLIGSMLTSVALPWFVLQTTGSAAMTGLAGFFVALPGFVAGVFGGTFVDRLGYKRMSVIADVVSGVTIMLVPLLYHSFELAFWQLLALIFIGNLLEIPGLTARRAMLPELAALARTRLERVNAAFESVQHVAMLLGPPLAGVLIVWLGASNVLGIDAMTFMVSAALIAMAVPAAPVAQRAATGQYRAELAAGLRFLRDDRLLLSLAISLAITNFFGNALFAVVLPVYAKQTFGTATTLGLIVAVVGASQLTGAVIFGAIGHRLPRRAMWILGYTTETLPLWAVVMHAPAPAILALIVVSGVMGGPLNPLLVTIRHERIPIEMRGRVFSTFSAISQVASPLGILCAGFAIEGVGLRNTIFVIAACIQAVAFGMLFVPAFREMNRPVVHQKEVLA